MNDRLIVIFGPTGVGKSQLGIELAVKFNGEIISMDSMQVYKGLDILTNKVTEEEAKGVKHHLISEVPLGYQFNANNFVSTTEGKIQEIRSRGKVPIIVGGTCYYAYSLFLQKNSSTGPEKSSRVLELEEKFNDLENTDSENFSEMSKILHEVDNDAYELVKHNKNKLRSYLNSFFRSHESIRARNRKMMIKHKNALLFWISSDRTVLNDRINRRANQMVTKGLKQEIRTFLDANNPVSFDSAQYAAIGLKQLMPLIDENVTNEIESECIERLKSVTRRYAAKQEKYILTKFCSENRPPGLPDVLRLDATEIERWNEKVRLPAEMATEKYLKNENFEIPGVILASRPSKFSSISDFFESRLESTRVLSCESCKVQVIEDQMEFHKKSKRHQKRLYNQRRKEKNLENLAKRAKV